MLLHGLRHVGAWHVNYVNVLLLRRVWHGAVGVVVVVVRLSVVVGVGVANASTAFFHELVPRQAARAPVRATLLSGISSRAVLLVKHLVPRPRLLGPG